MPSVEEVGFQKKKESPETTLRLGPKFSENALDKKISGLFLGVSKRIETVAVIESFF